MTINIKKMLLCVALLAGARALPTKTPGLRGAAIGQLPLHERSGRGAAVLPAVGSRELVRAADWSCVAPSL